MDVLAQRPSPKGVSRVERDTFFFVAGLEALSRFFSFGLWFVGLFVSDTETETNGGNR